MLEVISIEEVEKLLQEKFNVIKETETVSLLDANNRILAEDIKSNEYVPSFDRSSMDGYAVIASDTFGASETLPIPLKLIGKISMGESQKEIHKGECLYIPTGGALPINADSVVMIEHTEDYKDGTIGIMSPSVPGLNVIKKGDDLKPNEIIISKGTKLDCHNIGTLAALGISKVEVFKKLKVGIISTGDELIDISETPINSQIRDINSYVLSSFIKELNCIPITYGIIKDDKDELSKTIDKAVKDNDIVLISGGSSAGEKDVISSLLESKGELLFHGISIKPGKPTMLASIDNKPVWGIAGHPLAVYFISKHFLSPFINRLMGNDNYSLIKVKAILTESIDSNHGRSEFVPIKLTNKENKVCATPIISKSGLISVIANADGYTIIDRNLEGILKGTEIEVINVI